MKIRAIRIALAVVLTALATWAAAGETAARAAIERVSPGRPIQSVTETPVANLYEAAVDGQVFYVTGDGRYILGGPLIDAKTGANLTEMRREVVSAIAWERLPLKLAFKRVKGNGSRRIAIFEDPDCPYCKQLEKTLEGVNDITIYVLLFPIDQLHPQAAQKSRAIWCAKDRGGAWDDAMRTGIVPANPGTCETPIAEIAEFAKQHGITGTPTIILSDGRRVVGALPAAQLQQQLARASAKPN